MSDFSMTIGGSSVAAEDTFPVINPATGAAFAEAPNAPGPARQAMRRPPGPTAPGGATSEAARR